MLDSLDTLIAFVLIMLVVSLLITIAVQVASAAFNLRGINLAQGLRQTFGVIDSETDERSKELANYILKGQFLSDSFLPDWPILRWWRHADAVRPKEVFDAVQRIALGKEPDDYVSLWQRFKGWAGKMQTAPSAAPTVTVTTLQDKAQRILKGLGIEQDLITKAAQEMTKTKQMTKEFADAAEATYQRFQYWACIGEERAQQWLTMHARILTVIFAALAAIGLQLDSIDIFRLVSSNKSVRDKLVAQSAAVNSQAEKTLVDSKTVLEAAYDTWLTKADSKVKAALASVPFKVNPTDTRETVASRIVETLPPDINKDAVLSSFNGSVDQAVTSLLNKQAHDYSGVRSDLDNTGFDLFPKKGWRWGDKWSDGWSRRHGLGVLFSIGLLSLGAPFWYNSLKNLVSLRSQVAQNISAEQKQKPPDKPNAPPPTITPLPSPPALSPAESTNSQPGNAKPPMGKPL